MKKNLAEHWLDQMELPVIAAPMFLVSGPELVAACCKNGIIGSFPAPNARPIEVLDEWMGYLNEELRIFREENPKQKIAPWAMNVVAHSSYERIEDELKLIQKHKPELVITAVGNPKRYVEVVHEYGGLVFSDVSDVSFARKAAKAGSDGLILISAGSGGHSGTINNFAFVDMVRKFWDGYIILAGGISTGDGILSAQAIGADFAYLGTRFIPAKESMANNDYRQMLIDSDYNDIMYTDAFSGVNANILVPSILKAGLDPKNLKKKETIDFNSFHSEPKLWRDIWSAGHGVGTIQEVESTKSIIEKLKHEYKKACQRMNVTNRWT